MSKNRLKVGNGVTPAAGSNGSGREAFPEVTSTNPFRQKGLSEEEKLKRNRRRSIHRKIREQQSIDDDIGKERKQINHLIN
jgi:hypothetical protein